MPLLAQTSFSNGTKSGLEARNAELVTINNRNTYTATRVPTVTDSIESEPCKQTLEGMQEIIAELLRPLHCLIQLFGFCYWKQLIMNSEIIVRTTSRWKSIDNARVPFITALGPLFVLYSGRRYKIVALILTALWGSHGRLHPSVFNATAGASSIFAPENVHHRQPSKFRLLFHADKTKRHDFRSYHYVPISTIYRGSRNWPNYCMPSINCC